MKYLVLATVTLITVLMGCEQGQNPIATSAPEEVVLNVNVQIPTAAPKFEVEKSTPEMGYIILGGLGREDDREIEWEWSSSTISMEAYQGITGVLGIGGLITSVTDISGHKCSATGTEILAPGKYVWTYAIQRSYPPTIVPGDTEQRFLENDGAYEFELIAPSVVTVIYSF